MTENRGYGGLHLERITCSSMNFGQKDNLRIMYCPFCGSVNLFAAIKERLTICECGKKFEVTAYRLFRDDEEDDDNEEDDDD